MRGGSRKLDNGDHAWSYMTGVSVTYIGALNRVIELEKVAGSAQNVNL